MQYSWCIGHSLVPPISQELLIRSDLMRLPSARLSFRSIKARVQDISGGGREAEEGEGVQLPGLGPPQAAPHTHTASPPPREQRRKMEAGLRR